MDLKALSQKQIQQSELRLLEFLRRFERELNPNIRRIVKKLKAGDIKTAEAAQVIGQINTALEQLGLTERLKDVTKLHINEVAEAKQYFDTLGVGQVFSGADTTFVQTLIDYDVAAVRTKIFAGTDALKSGLFRAVVNGNIDQIDDLIDGATGQIGRAVETELRTALSGFQQTVIGVKADEAELDLYIYVGPDDKITRDFCADVLDEHKVWTRDEIDGLENDQGLDPFIYGGGYNCRHQWRPVTKEWAEENGYQV